MPVKFAIAGRSSIDVDVKEITLGSDPGCTVSFPESANVKPKHAVIHSIAGRWLIELREGESIILGGSELRRPHWLTPGDEFRLCKGSPAIIFEPTADKCEPSENEFELAADDVKPTNDGFKLLDDEDDPPVDEVEFTIRGVKLPLDDKPLVGADSPPPTKKSPSSGSIPTRKQGSSSTIPVTSSDDPSDSTESSRSREKPKSSGTIRTRSSEESAVKVPTLQRMSFNDVIDEHVEGDEDDFGFKKRTKLTSEQQELRWVLMIVGRCVGAGLAVVIVWLAISWIWKAFSPAAVETTTVMHSEASSKRLVERQI